MHRAPDSLNKTCKHTGREASHSELNMKQEYTFGEKWCSANSYQESQFFKWKIFQFRKGPWTRIL